MSSAAQAYDRAAASYDTLASGALRERLHAAYRRVIRPGDRVIDAGCGTGIDSAFLVELGAEVTGIDVSAAMLEIARRRAYARTPRFLRGDIQRLDTLVASPVDAVVSGFAALNTVEDLAAFAESARACLRTGGALVVHVLTPGGVFDRLGDASRGRVLEAVRHRRMRVRDVRIGDTVVPHRMVRPDVLYQHYFATKFALEDLQQHGAFTPDDGPSRIPPALERVLGRLDAASGRWPWVRHHGRFAILTLRAR